MNRIILSLQLFVLFMKLFCITPACCIGIVNFQVFGVDLPVHVPIYLFNIRFMDKLQISKNHHPLPLKTEHINKKKKNLDKTLKKKYWKH